MRIQYIKKDKNNQDILKYKKIYYCNEEDFLNGNNIDIYMDKNKEILLGNFDKSFFKKYTFIKSLRNNLIFTFFLPISLFLVAIHLFMKFIRYIQNQFKGKMK